MRIHNSPQCLTVPVRLLVADCESAMGFEPTTFGITSGFYLAPLEEVSTGNRFTRLKRQASVLLRIKRLLLIYLIATLRLLHV